MRAQPRLRASAVMEDAGTDPPADGPPSKLFERNRLISSYPIILTPAGPRQNPIDIMPPAFGSNRIARDAIINI